MASKHHAMNLSIWACIFVTSAILHQLAVVALSNPKSYSAADVFVKQHSTSTTGVRRSINSSNNGCSSSIASTRRSFGFGVVKFFGIACVLTPSAASAKDSQQAQADKQKLLKGYQRLEYLLSNWVDETTICGQSDNPYIGKNGCERTPLKVMDYMGYKSMDDPLFKADKTMKRLEALVTSGREGEFVDAVEKWCESSESANGMAYVSSWGEANPGGGKDRVEYFIERAKKNVVDARDSLATIIDILEIK